MRYVMSDKATVDGVIEAGPMNGEVVDREYVERYMVIEMPRFFFVNRGGTEEFRKTKSGIIMIRAVRPDGEHREIRFTPTRNGE